MDFKIALSYEQGHTVTGYCLIPARGPKSVADLKNDIIRGFDLTGHPEALLMYDKASTARVALSDDYVLEEGSSREMDVVVRMAHVIYKIFALGCEPLYIGKLYSQEEWVAIADVREATRRRFGHILPYLKTAFVTYYRSDGTNPISDQAQFRKEATEIYIIVPSESDSPMHMDTESDARRSHLQGLMKFLVTNEIVHRSEAIRRILATLSLHQFVVIFSPPLTGKTYLLKSFGQQLHRNFSYFRLDNSMDTTVAKEMIFSVTHVMKDTADIILGIDDAHEAFSDPSFWEDLLESAQQMSNGRSIQCIISATYVHGAITTLPPALSRFPCFGIRDLRLDDVSCRAACFSHIPDRWRSYAQLVDKIVADSAGHVGVALTLCYNLYELDKLGIASQSDLLRFYESNEVVCGLSNCFSNFNMPSNRIPVRPVLLNLAHSPSECKPSPEPGTEEADVVMQLEQAGILDHNQDGGNYTFASVQARNCVFRWIFGDRPVKNPASLRSLLETVLSKLSTTSLRMSTTEGVFPLEAVFQHQFYSICVLSLPGKCKVYSEYAIRAADDERIQGRIDFFINDNLRWGVELLVNGDRLQEHLERFSPSGRYRGLNSSDYIVVDFRRGPVTNVQKNTKRATVFVDDSLEFCDLWYAMDPAPLRIILAD